MTARTLYPIFGALAVAVVGGLGYLEGPLVAMGVVGSLLGLVTLGFLLRRSGEPASPRAEPAATEPAVAPVGPEPPFYRGLGPLVGLAVVARLGMAVLTNSTDLWLSFAPDSYYWMLAGEALLAHWADPLVPLTPMFGSEEARPFYAVVNAVLGAVFGVSRYPPSILNGFIDIWAAYNFGRLADHIYGREAARRTFIAGLFFPSLVLWSSMNIREAWSFLIISYMLLATHRLRTRFSPADAALLVGSIGAMYFIRAYLVPLLFGAIVLSYLVVRVRHLPYAVVSLVVILFLAQSVGPQFGLDPALLSGDSLEVMDEMRRGLAYGGSAYGAEADTRTVSGSIAYLPEGVARFLLGPYPWAVQSWRQMLTVPESLVWYWIVLQALWVLGRDLRKNLTRVAPAFFVLLFVTAAYGLVSGNEGTAYRHRAQIIMIVFVFASARRLPSPGSGALSAARPR
jgi:hypothetical protein